MTTGKEELHSIFDSMLPPGANGGGTAGSLASAIAEAVTEGGAAPAPAPFEKHAPEPAPFTARMLEELPSWTPTAPPEPAPPPELPPSPAPPVITDDLDWDDVDAGFASIQTDPGAPGSAPAVTDVRDMAAVEDLFKQIAATHVIPIRDFAVELSLGEASPEWYRVCIPAVLMLRTSAEEMGVPSMTARLDGMLDVLRAGEGAGSSTVTSPEREAILAAYDALAAELPAIPSAAEERDRREPIMVQALLRQVPGVRDVALDKLFSAGLTRFDFYYRATPREIADTSGLPYTLAEAILTRFLRYRDYNAAIPPASKRAAELGELEALVRELERHNRAYQNGASGWSAAAQESRRNARKERGDAVLKITLLLARLGEVDLIATLERLPFEHKVQAVDAFIETARKAQEAQ